MNLLKSTTLKKQGATLATEVCDCPEIDAQGESRKKRAAGARSE